MCPRRPSPCRLFRCSCSLFAERFPLIHITQNWSRHVLIARWSTSGEISSGGWHHAGGLTFSSPNINLCVQRPPQPSVPLWEKFNGVHRILLVATKPCEGGPIPPTRSLPAHQPVGRAAGRERSCLCVGRRLAWRSAGGRGLLRPAQRHPPAERDGHCHR